MEHARMVKLSKRMSKALRHDPGRVGLTLDEAGWVPVSDLLSALGVDRSALDEVVATNDKRRFMVERGPDGVDRIRANQGHSVTVGLGFTPLPPPELLYHGTSVTVLDSIRATGRPRSRRSCSCGG